MSRLIDADALYERACELEAQALEYVGKIANDETKIEEWRIWSAILAERTAFKHDIFDAPEVKPEMKWIPCSEKAHPDLPIRVQVQLDNGWIITAYYQNDEWMSVPDCGAQLDDDEIEAWRELPEPYREEGD